MNKEKIYLNRRYVNQRTNNCEKVYLYDKNPEQNKPKFPTFSKRSYKKGDRVVIIGSKFIDINNIYLRCHFLTGCFLLDIYHI